MYEMLAKELMDAIEQNGPVPPKDKISESIRGEMAVLRLLGRENRQIAAGEISRLLNMTTSRIAAVLGSLEKKAFITRRTDPEDKRRVLVALTEKGRAFYAERKEEVRRHVKMMLMRLGEDDAREYVRLMKRISEILPEIAPQQNTTEETQ
ncbi:MAG: winged helix DNA-binding protein [Clostridia bacterium]|nr:winged helix DNA-binding protein [Clostridia bacterium]